MEMSCNDLINAFNWAFLKEPTTRKSGNNNPAIDTHDFEDTNNNRKEITLEKLKNPDNLFKNQIHNSAP